jgi:hypothetical protein
VRYVPEDPRAAFKDLRLYRPHFLVIQLNTDIASGGRRLQDLSADETDMLIGNMHAVYGPKDGSPFLLAFLVRGRGFRNLPPYDVSSGKPQALEQFWANDADLEDLFLKIQKEAQCNHASLPVSYDRG